jgi:ATP-binding cassette subfamily B protein
MEMGIKSYLYSLAHKYKLYLFSVALLAISAGLFDIFVEYQIKEIIDSITKNPTDDILSLLLLFILYKLMHHGVWFAIRIFDIHYKPKMLKEIVEGAYKKTVAHSLHWFDSHLSGEIASKITDLQDAITIIVTILNRSLANVAAIIIGIAFLFMVNYLVAVVLIAFVLIYVPVLLLLLKKQMKLQEEYAKARQESVGIINDSIPNIFGVKIIGNVWTELTMKLVPSVNKWKSWDRKTKAYDAYYVDMTDTVLVVTMGAVQMWLLAYLYQTGQITAGDFAFTAMVTLHTHWEIDQVLENILFHINPKMAVIRSSFNFINAKLDVVDSKDARIISDVKGEITYKDVKFGYDKRSAIFEGLNLHINSGERVGIVGTSGAGKTTLIKCLLRYFDLQEGSIFIDGYNIREVTQESLRANISVIPQDITMFHRSILENLQFAKYDATLEEIQEACKKARIHDEIEKMPKGYNSMVGERGTKISGGQRQRIAIARAILKNAPILILDEATSALDTPTESLIQESIDEILKISHATAIVIAHRLSTLLHTDRILVFEQGKIIEDGTHAELLAKGGAYATLWNSQINGFLPNKKNEK